MKLKLKKKTLKKTYMTATTKVSKNGNMHKAKAEKNNEFYTLLTDIEKELWNYKDQFKGKVVYCNCDDPMHSNFFKYFSLNFEFLGLKKLVTTHYGQDKKSYKLEITGDTNGDGKINQFDTVKTELEGNGDFSSPECIEMLNQCDIVVSNPPFSLARLYLDVLINSGKQFLFISNLNAITYKEFFKNIKENKLWLGYTSPKEFVKPNGEIQKFGNIIWYTNMDTNKRHEDLFLYKTYNETDYPKFDNYDAINCDKTKDIPCDFYGCIGVPITFLDKYNPEQFELIGATESEGKGFSNGLWYPESKVAQPLINGNKIYKRLFIKRKQ